MGLFGKSKKQREKEEQERLEAEEKELQRPRRIKDLNPENSRKRKAPPKPWTKKERLLIIGVLGFTVITSAVLAAGARSWKLPGLPRLTKPNFSLEETIILDNPKKSNQKWTELEDSINSLTKNLSGVYSVYVYDLNQNEEFGFQEDQSIQAASLIKLPVLGLMYQKAEQGDLLLSTRHTLKDSDKIAGSGSLYARQAGEIFTYRELAKYMSKESDNTAFGIMRNQLGDDAIDVFSQQIGMEKTVIGENLTSARDIGIFFRKLWNKQIVSEENRDEILGFLTNTIYEDWIPASLPEGTKVAHKYGREVHVINDAGIVWGESEYVLVVMTQGIVEKEASVTFPQIVKLVDETIQKE